VISPDHLLDQANGLIVSGATGRPRQVDYRRALSATYYALFHAALIKAVELIIPQHRRQSPNYKLVYRSLDHKKLRDVCGAIKQQNPPLNFSPYFPAHGFSADLIAFATAVVEAYEKRHLADYDPFYHVTRSDASVMVATARAALVHLGQATADDLFSLATLLFFTKR
jgi:uncharacterized protein (UPF0332 family)